MTVRAATIGDLGAVAGLLDHEIEHGYAHFGTEPTDRAALERAILEGAFPFLVAEQDGTFAGFARASAWKTRGGYRWTAEVGVYVRPGAQGSGVGSALYTQLLPLCRDRGLHTLVAGIALPNEPSVRLHERFGFSPAGVLPFVGYKQGRWIDVGYWVLHFPGTPERVS